MTLDSMKPDSPEREAAEQEYEAALAAFKRAADSSRVNKLAAVA